MGLFYELLSSALFGGSVRNPATKYNAHDNYEGHDEEELMTCPDVVCDKRESICESKAMRIGHQLYLLEDQIDKYASLQILKPNYDIRFIIYRHSFPKVNSYEGSEIQLYKDLAAQTKAGFSIPLRMVLELEQYGHDHDCTVVFIQWYHNPVYGNGYRVKGPFMSGINFYPDKLFEHMNLKGYEAKRYLVKGLTVNRNKMRPFPFMLITDKTEWVRNYYNAILGDIPF